MSFSFLHFSFPFILLSFFTFSCTTNPSPSENRAPVAHPGGDMRIQAGASVDLNGSASSDPDGDFLDFEWKLVPSPDGEVVEGAKIVNQDFKVATLILSPDIDIFTEQVVELTVSDGEKSHSATITVTITPYDSFYHWNERFAPAPWDQDSNPYSCFPEENPDSPWVKAGLVDLGGGDPLSLIRYYGNGSYLRYSAMGFGGCTSSDRNPNAFYMDPPADPTYYSTKDIDIYVDIIRVPVELNSDNSPIPNQGWFHDNGTRTEMSMADALTLLNDHVATYYTRASEGHFNITFVAGLDINAEAGASSSEVGQLHTDSVLSEHYPLEDHGLQKYPNIGNYGTPGALSRMLLHDVPRQASWAFNSGMTTGLDNLVNANMSTILHEIGHGWMNWAHSFPELPWEVTTSSNSIEVPNPYSNRYDFMSNIGRRFPGWNHDTFPLPLAINRYSAGWIDPKDVALHTTESGTYTLVPPLEDGKQFLVIHSGRPRAFTTLEVLEDRDSYYREAGDVIYDSSAEGNKRPRRYNGVLVSRYDQSAGSGTRVRFGPALHNEQNPDVLKEAGIGRDDASVLIDGETASLGGGVSVSVAAVSGSMGNYEVTVSGGKEASFPRWCRTIQGSEAYDPDCLLNDYVVAQAGPQRERAAGATVVKLDGRESFGRSDKTFSWTQESGTPVTLTGADTAQASFTTPAAGVDQIELVFRLTVSLDVESGDESGTTKTHTDDITIYIPAARLN